MKRVLVLAVLLGICVTGCPNKDWTITMNWGYDFTNAPICSSSVVNGCVNGFTWGVMNGTTQVPLKTSPITVCTGSTQPEACTDTTNSLLPINTSPGDTFYVVANYLDSTGKAQQTSAALSAPVPVPAATPTGASATIK